MPPEFINRPKDTNLSVQEGQSISLDCSASGQPKPNITWTHNTKLEHDNKKYSFNSAGVLTIRNIHGSDFGIYRCFVVSVAGTLYREYNVTVIGRYFFHSLDLFCSLNQFIFVAQRKCY